MKGGEKTKHYTIRIDGHLDPSWQERLEDLEIIHEVSGTTVLCGYLPDQAALYGVLLTLHRLSLTLLSLEMSEALPLAASGEE
jgi:hypothetical protein